MYRIGIDLGGTKIEGIVLKDEMEIFRKRIPTQREKGYEFILEQITRLYGALKQEVGGKEHTLGLGTPGAVSVKTGQLKNSNTTCLNGKPFRSDLEKKLGRKFGMQNDANCFAMAEAFLGAAKNKELVFGVIMGTGCGGGIVHKGQVLYGLQGIAGEWGHSTIDPEGPQCYCGKRGCVETLISGAGLEKIYEKHYGCKKTLHEIVTFSRSGDHNARIFMELFYKNFGRALSNVVNILDPDVVVLGGGVSNIDEIYTTGIEYVKKNIFSDSCETVIVKNTLGDSAGVIGAAFIGE